MAAPTEAPAGHLHPKGKPPSEHTLRKLREARATLAFPDTRDFEEHDRGFIAPMETGKIMADGGHVAWDMERYQFLLEADDYDSIHPSLMRQSVLNSFMACVSRCRLPRASSALNPAPNGGCRRNHQGVSRMRAHVGLIASLYLFSATGLAAQEHFDPKGKLSSPHTVEIIEGLRGSLPFADERDFEEARRGLIAAPTYKQIMSEKGNVAWDIGSYDWLLEGQDFDSIHPSLQRIAVLNMAYGLYEVIPDKIYQVRGYDLANISFIKGDTGWIVFDPLTAKETAAAALAFINEQVGERPVVAVVYSHSHADHFGGVRGVIDEADVRSGSVKVIAPVGFMDHAVAENVYAGNAMSRRLFYQYGVLLPRSPFGHVDQSIGKNVAAGNTGLIEPNIIVAEDFEEMTVDGVRMIFQNTPGTEAPAEMNTYFPDLKAFWAAENITGTIHNI